MILYQINAGTVQREGCGAGSVLNTVSARKTGGDKGNGSVCCNGLRRFADGVQIVSAVIDAGVRTAGETVAHRSRAARESTAVVWQAV